MSGSGSATLRFAYTVAAGDLDTDGAAVAANGLELPSGSTLVTVAQRETVLLPHGAQHDPAHRVDAVGPTPASASVAGPVLTLTWSEALMPDAAAIRPDKFTVRIDGAAEPALRAAASNPIDRRELTLTLARSIAPGTTGITVDYRPGTTPVKDFAGNTAEGFTGRTVALQSAVNSPVTGRATVSGTARVGQTLTATLSDLADPDGLAAAPIYTFTWIRIDGTSEEVITTTRTDLARSRHLLTVADAGKKVKVKVAFDDHVGNDETIESDAFPSFGSIAWDTQASCAMPDLIGRDLVWTGLLTVGSFTTGGVVTYGYSANHTGSTLSDTTFTLGTTGYTIDYLAVVTSGTFDELLEFSTTADLPTTATNALRLHVCDSGVDFSDARSYAPTTYTYAWNSFGLDWSTTSTRRLYLSQADETAPVLQLIGIDGATATLTYDEALKATSPTPSAFTIGVTGGGTLTASGVRAGVGTNKNQVTLTPNGVAAFTTGQNNGTYDVPEVDNVTPSVRSVAFAGAAAALAIGDKVEIDAVFTQAVRVTTSSTARPQIGVLIGTETHEARYVSGSDSATLRFEYVIDDGDADTDGIAIAADALNVPSGSSIVTQTGNRAVQLGHDAVAADAARTVDGIRPEVAETGAVEVAGPTVTVTWSEALDETSVPSRAGGFGLRFASGTPPAVNSVRVSGTQTVLTLASPVADGTPEVTLDYTPQEATPVRDANGNPAAAFTGKAATVTLDTRAPQVAAASVDGTALRLTFDEALDPASIPAAPGGFTVTVTRGGSTESGFSVSALEFDSSGTVLTLTLNRAVRGGDAVVLAYAPPSTNPLRDRAAAANGVAAFTTGQNNGTYDVLAVDNVTPSVRSVLFAGAAAALAIDDKVEIDVTFTEAVRVTVSGSARPQVAVAVGTATRQARYVSGTGSAVLRFEYTVAQGDADTDGIMIAANALNVPSGSSIRTQAGARTVQFGHDAVAAEAARTVDGTRPTVMSAAAEGLTVTVT